MASTHKQREISSMLYHHAHRWKYDVFLSFRGEDTRKSFCGHLYAALDQKGIFTFKDNHRLERGKVILSELFNAIEESRFSVVVISENYASSKWCLEELTKILECMKLMGQTVLPIFYKVNPSEVRKQTGNFDKAFAEHERIFGDNMEKVQKWRDAMREIGNLAGWDLQDREESEVIEDIVNMISSKVCHTFLSAFENLVGIDSRLQQMDLLLGSGPSDVRMVGICGMGGIGKTTLARVLFDKIFFQFHGCSFLANVREVSMTQDLVALQERLFSEILMEKNILIGDIHRGCHVISSRLCQKKVLVILDDVDKLEQLQALAGRRDWFGSGSRIIITTRDRHLLVRHGVDNIYMVDKLNVDEAFQLFCWKAFRKGHPTDGYFELSYSMVNYAGGLPLALEVLGSFLFGRSQAEWKAALDRLKEIPDRKIFEILKISYDGLLEVEQRIFLDIACFFKGKDKDRVTKFLDCCKFYPDIGISVLIDKCMITLSNNKLCVHDLIQDMGREIVRQENPKQPGQRSRLWLQYDVCRVLTENEGTEAVEGIMANFLKYAEVNLNAKSFSRMKNLRMLKIHGACRLHRIDYLPNELRLLKWLHYPLASLPSNFRPENLYKLSMCCSRLRKLWQGAQNMNQLKMIKLSRSELLAETPDFTGTPNLERLILDGCTNLSFLHPSVGLLKRLNLLILKDCKQLKNLPTQIEWESLEVLILSGCSKLRNVKEVGNAKHLLRLLLDGTAIEEVSPSIQCLTRLTMFDLNNCKSLISVPDSICDLRSLKVLNLNGCSRLDSLPENLGHISSLEKLDLGGTAIHRPPSSIVLLQKLEELSFHGCRGLLPKSWASLFWFPFPSRAKSYSKGFFIPSLSGLHSLTRLDLGDCNIQEGAIPKDIGCLSSLTYLNLSRNYFFSLPATINQLSKLETLNVDYCSRLQALPELPSSIDGLFAYDCISLEKVSSPSNIIKSQSRMFYFTNCFKLTGNLGNNSVPVTFFKSLLQSLLKSQLQGLQCRASFSEFEIVIPGSRVPEWFIYQCSLPSVLANVTSNSCTGLAICAAFSFHNQRSAFSHQDLTLTVDFKCLLDINLFKVSPLIISFNVNTLSQSDHLWLFYLSRSCFSHTLLQNDHLVIRASFIPDIQLKVKACGLRPIYTHDIEELTQASNKDGFDDLAFDTLSGKTIVKRSRDHYLHCEQLNPKRLR